MFRNRIAILQCLTYLLGNRHIYLSTGCLHGDHEYCKSMTGVQGVKRPGECKHCKAPCICGCHQSTEPTE